MNSGTHQLQHAVKTVLVQLSATISELTMEEYGQPCSNLFGNTIGQHVRHIIELFQCLEKGYDSGIINYEKRNRDKLIETDPKLACLMLPEIHTALVKPNRDLILEASYDEHNQGYLQIHTNFEREIAYNLEHTIHHMALIRVGVTEVSALTLPEEFGVAPSTVKYRKACAQ
jgi:hypothetical protein